MDGWMMLRTHIRFSFIRVELRQPDVFSLVISKTFHPSLFQFCTDTNNTLKSLKAKLQPGFPKLAISVAS